jgi:hypothetical protein
MLGLRVQIPLRAQMFVSCVYMLFCVGRGLWNGQNTRPEEHYRASNCVLLRNLNSEEGNKLEWANPLSVPKKFQLNDNTASHADVSALTTSPYCTQLTCMYSALMCLRNLLHLLFSLLFTYICAVAGFVQHYKEINEKMQCMYTSLSLLLIYVLSQATISRLELKGTSFLTNFFLKKSWESNTSQKEVLVYFNKHYKYERFQVLTAVSMKFRVFWDVLPCSQIDVDQLSRRVYTRCETLNFTINMNFFFGFRYRIRKLHLTVLAYVLTKSLLF